MAKKSIYLTLFNHSVAIFIAMIIGNILLTFGPAIQANLYPVVSKAQILNETQVKDGVVFYVKFTKNYDCKFIGVNWYQGAHRIELDFLEDHDDKLLSRPAGDQYTGPWKLHNILTTKGTWATAVHKCGLWEVQTPFHP